MPWPEPVPGVGDSAGWRGEVAAGGAGELDGDSQAEAAALAGVLVGGVAPEAFTGPRPCSAVIPGLRSRTCRVTSPPEVRVVARVMVRAGWGCARCVGEQVVDDLPKYAQQDDHRPGRVPRRSSRTWCSAANADQL